MCGGRGCGGGCRVESAPGLHHYFPSRDALVTALVAKAYNDLADAVQAAVDGTAVPAVPPVPRLVVAAEGHRGWAITHPERFQLLYGAPLRDYVAPVRGSTPRAMLRMSAIFQRELSAGFTAEQLAAADVPEPSSPFRAHLESEGSDGTGALPPPAAPLLLSAWGHMHNLVVLEVFGHMPFLGDHRAEPFRTSTRTMLADLHRRIPATGPD
ncbi:TetR/AcrR family transcriptional regulator [Streptomyces sp. KMM 9044]|uniref:TetR/AcrR family transcriptional regulator n=1 Tax=Streptomyces sp. KMM 9044 TaxID=2744474 RepID=UPI0021513CE0|nr:TetR-like C-terminal domain-containing protein [Streptomyces sp. KMM 9044]WAX79002.1 TetR-like C-terminal domain-containing protein [Streptomyces sp. KMM 9044]